MVFSYLAGGDELERTKRAAHVGDVAFELVESRSDVGLDLRWVLARRAVARDLVECGRRHGCDCVLGKSDRTARRNVEVVANWYNFGDFLATDVNRSGAHNPRQNLSPRVHLWASVHTKLRLPYFVKSVL